MKGKRARSAGALMLGLAVLFCTLTAGPGRAYGASAIDTEKTDCRITFTLDVDVLERAGELAGLEETAPGYEQYYAELAKYLRGEELGEGTGGSAPAGNAIQADLYRIASVNAGGAYTLLPEYQSIEELEGVESADSDTPAGQWLEWAQAAAERAVGTTQEDGKLQPPAAGELSPDTSVQITLTDGKAEGTAQDLRTGLYLVWVKPVDTDYYRYSFVPFLISLPNNYYNPDETDSSDEWIYGDEEGKPVYVGLKPEREDRYGDLVIEKILSSYNETLDGASFVFEVKAVKENTLVYSDVVSLTFDGYGSDRVIIEHIPAGAAVTVTEVYSGAGYVPADGALEKNTMIAADSDSAKVTFENRYDGKLNGGGTSVVNHFTYEKDESGKENLDWEKQDSSSGTIKNGTGNNGTDNNGAAGTNEIENGSGNNGAAGNDGSGNNGTAGNAENSSDSGSGDYNEDNITGDQE